jgi:hypothetical protein
MAKLGTKYFTRGKVMIGIAAEGSNRPLIPFDPRVDKIDCFELVKKCEGITAAQAEGLFADLESHFMDQVATEWLRLPGFVDLADTRKIRILNEETA